MNLIVLVIIDYINRETLENYNLTYFINKTKLCTIMVFLSVMESSDIKSCFVRVELF